MLRSSIVMEMFTTHFLDWTILFALVGGAIYTLKIIGKEKTTFKEESYEVQFEGLSLQIPNWWTIVDQTDQQLRFERTDTRYDWFALYTYVPDNRNKTLPDLLEEKLNRENLEFDLDVQFETDSRVLFRNPETRKHFQEIIRVEGKATQDVVDRVYYDIYLMRSEDHEGHFIFESKSSVLNGLVEGPYFEESLSELKLNGQ